MKKMSDVNKGDVNKLTISPTCPFSPFSPGRPGMPWEYTNIHTGLGEYNAELSVRSIY